VIQDKQIDKIVSIKLLQDLKDRPDLVQFTFENNSIIDVEGVCTAFAYLKNMEKLEGINFRCNNFNE
jgi:hypothetical protein